MIKSLSWILSVTTFAESQKVLVMALEALRERSLRVSQAKTKPRAGVWRLTA